MVKLLTSKQQAFVHEYLVDFNATQAARRAGYEGNEASLAVIGSQNLRKYHIQNAIQNHLNEKSMFFEEVIYRLSQQARGSIGDFISFDEEGKWTFDINKAIDTGAIDLVEKMIFIGSRGADGSVARHLHIKLYSAQKALIQLGKAYGLWKGNLLHHLKLPQDEETDYDPPMMEENGE